MTNEDSINFPNSSFLMDDDSRYEQPEKQKKIMNTISYNLGNSPIILQKKEKYIYISAVILHKVNEITSQIPCTQSNKYWSFGLRENHC
jgi:hypothetical protein